MAKNTGTGSEDRAPKSTSEAAQTPLTDDLKARVKSGGDPFQETMIGLIDFIERHKAIVLGALGVAVLGGVGYVGWGMVEQRQQKSAQESFYELEKRFSEKHDGFERAKFAKLLKQPVKSGEKPPEAASGDMAKDYGSLVSDLEQFASSHKRFAAGAQAALLAAETYVKYNQAERAAQVLEPVVMATKTDSALGGLLRMAKGNALALAGQCDKALSSWEQVIAAKSIGFLHGEAALRAGLCLEKSGQKDRAIEMYRKAAGDSERSESAQTAKSLLRALELGS